MPLGAFKERFHQLDVCHSRPGYNYLSRAYPLAPRKGKYFFFEMPTRGTVYFMANWDGLVRVHDGSMRAVAVLARVLGPASC